MAVPGISGFSNNQSSENSANKTVSTSLDSQAFLKLLLVQLKNQDPTAPMDSTQWMAQLAHFSAVEQQTATNSKLDALLTASSLASAENYVGKTITSADGSVMGVVKSVRIFSDGLVAKVAGGEEIIIEPGITVS